MSNKYKAKKTQVYGLWFDSKAEALHYVLLKGRQRKGEISGLELQPKFQLNLLGHHIGTYTPDFGYVEHATARTPPVLVVEDTKGVRTEAFALRAKLFQALYPHIELRVNGVKIKTKAAA